MEMLDIFLPKEFSYFPCLHFSSLIAQVDAIFVTEGVMEKELEANKVEIARNQIGEIAVYDVSISPMYYFLFPLKHLS